MNPRSILRGAIAALTLVLVMVVADPPARAQAAAGGRLTAHVLDLYTGAPANGMQIDLLAVSADGGNKVLRSVKTNADGRPPEGPLLTAETIKTGRYQAVVYIGDYYKRIGAKVPAGFHNRLILEFDILDTKLPHHLPFQITPFTQSASVLPG